jgi:hypothetical protein
VILRDARQRTHTYVVEYRQRQVKTIGGGLRLAVERAALAASAESVITVSATRIGVPVSSMRPRSSVCANNPSSRTKSRYPDGEYAADRPPLVSLRGMDPSSRLMYAPAVSGAPEPKYKINSPGQDLRKQVAELSRCESRDGRRRTAAAEHAQQRAKLMRREEDRALGAPGAAVWVRCIGQRLRRSPVNRDAVQFSSSKERNSFAVRRP